MKFALFLEQNCIQEWFEFYINYKELKNLLDNMKVKYKRVKENKQGNVSFQSISFINDSEDDLVSIARDFKEELIVQLNKVFHFFVENMNYYNKRINKFQKQLSFISQNPTLKHYKSILELAIKELYKELTHMRSFITINQKAEEKIIKKFKKYSKVCVEKSFVALLTEEIKHYSLSVLYNDDSLTKTFGELERLFNLFFFDQYGLTCVKTLKRYVDSNELSYNQFYYFGVFTGMLFVVIMIIIIISINYEIDMDDDKAFKQIFPMFRGILLIALYLWVLVINTYFWNKYHVSYKLCFKFKNHSSSLVAQMKRSASLLTISCLMILCYLIQRAGIARDILTWIYYIPLNMTPLICWMGFFIYLLCPIKSIFNYEGRKYFIDTLILCFQLNPEFPCIWLGDQFISLSGLLRDFSYTICYYINYNSNYMEIKDNCNPKSAWILFVSLIPAFIRFGTCVNICLINKSFFPQGLNAAKYGFSVLAAYCSYLFSQNENFFYLWLVIATISGAYAFVWDLKMDWGFLQIGTKNFLLRDKLVIKDLKIYYLSIFWDFVFRFFFVLTLSPQIVYSFIRPEFLTMLILGAEVIRRGLWNTIRVENRHIEVCKDFRSTLFIETPFYEDQNGQMKIKEFSAKKDLDFVNERLKKIRHSSYLLVKKKIKSEDFLKRLVDPGKYDFFVDTGSDHDQNSHGHVSLVPRTRNNSLEK